MIKLPSKTYLLTEDSPAAPILEELGVVFGDDEDGQRSVELDPILMVALLALQGRYMPTVSSLIELWKKLEEDSQDENPTEKGE